MYGTSADQPVSLPGLTGEGSIVAMTAPWGQPDRKSAL